MTIDQLVTAHLERIGTDIERWLELLAADAVVEFPYAGSLGIPPRLEGRDAIRRYFVETIAGFEGLTFTDVRTHVTSDPDVALVEVHGAAHITATGRRYEQDYVMLVKARQGRIALYREYWNPLPAIAAFGMEAKR
jgi:ketosteroid isomerase-like protein